MTIDKIEKEVPVGVSPRGKVVVLNGFHGTGKLTILNNLQSKLVRQDTFIIDNHFIIDPVQKIYPDRGLNHYYLRQQLRQVIFKEIRKMVDRGCVVLMTACLGNNEGDRKVLDEHLDIIRGTDIPMFWINVSCDQRTLEERLTKPGRVQGNKSKLTNVEILQNMTKNIRIIIPSVSRHRLEDISLVTASLDVGGGIEEAVNKVYNVVEGRHTKL
ncbi:hypothetical protein CEP54_000573 [Fusarium duplospermum]|uniref:Uncharacterized protein n=1 Tax=Fusarium duplospermum TaxID=1325734 RepID=A0A428R5Q2_9HYPO|nr:hypothetical protein CEP54_000573 [Fusarium duplospermum]